MDATKGGSGQCTEEDRYYVFIPLSDYLFSLEQNVSASVSSHVCEFISALYYSKEILLVSNPKVEANFQL